MWNRMLRFAVLGAGLPNASASLLTSSSDQLNPALRLPTLDPELVWNFQAFPPSQTLFKTGFEPVVELKNMQLPVNCDASGRGYYNLILHEDYECAYFAQSDKNLNKIKRMFKLRPGLSHPLYIWDGYPMLFLLKAVPKGASDVRSEAYQHWVDWSHQTETYSDIHFSIAQETLIVNLLGNNEPAWRIAIEMVKSPRMPDHRVYKAVVEGPVPFHRVSTCPAEFLLSSQHLQGDPMQFLGTEFP